MLDKVVSTHSYAQLIHTFPTSKNASEQGFSSLSTDNRGGYYYYLYIQETRPQANPTGLPFENRLKTQLTKKRVTQTELAMQDFQLKKKRVAA
jgi:hypothetical protein